MCAAFSVLQPEGREENQDALCSDQTTWLSKSCLNPPPQLPPLWYSPKQGT